MFDETRMTLSASITGNHATMNRETDFNTLEFFFEKYLKITKLHEQNTRNFYLIMIIAFKIIPYCFKNVITRFDIDKLILIG